MSSNTIKRFVSAFVLIAIVLTCLYFGKRPTLFLILLCGALTVDELFVNFLKKCRISFSYIVSQALFIAPFVYFNFFEKSSLFFLGFVNAGVGLNLVLLFYLFMAKMESSVVINLFRSASFLTGFYILLPLMSLSQVVDFENWRQLLGVLLAVNFGMDTGAWFFGKNFGKHKLWEKVSPNKTIEGLIGGMVTAGVLGVLTWNLLLGQLKYQLFVVFCLLGLLSQLGDLIQSKLKRQFSIKDSSSLIPGHGGIYDRIDSLIFLAPFFAIFIYNISFK
jgi:phosphatidate cytidylyltransferase